MTREQLRSDRERHNEITRHRWTLLHLTDHDVYRAPQQMVRTAARALGVPEPREVRRLRPARSPDDHGPQDTSGRRVLRTGP